MGKLSGKTVEAIAAYRAGATEEVGDALKGLRKMSGITQNEMAKRLNVQQSAISKIESSNDIHLSTIKKYVEALGAMLRIDASFASDTPLALKIRDSFDIEYGSDDQLVLPILADEPFRPQRDVVLSIKPQYSDKIIEGLKTVELRRRFPVSAPHGTIAYIYSTSPVRAIVGSAQIKDVMKLPVSEIWKRFSKEAFIEKADFEKYFEGTDFGFALLFEQVKPLDEPITLEVLRQQFDFTPPQSFLYAKRDLRKALRHESAVVSH